MRFLIALIPAPLRIYVMVGAGVLILGALALAGIVWKIDRRGYNRCEASYSSAALALKDQARKDILELEEKFDEVRSEIHNTTGANPVCGPRVVLAIDSMPGAPGSE